MSQQTYRLEDLIKFNEAMLTECGFISQTTAAKHFGVSRQAIRKRLHAAHERGELSDELFRKFHPAATAGDLVKREMRLSPENDDFVTQMAQTHQVPITTVVNAALTRYRNEVELSENARA